MSEIPNEWKCPITHMIMRVPVIAEDGITYEESAIKEWLNSPNSSGRSPVTNVQISISGLKINYALKSMIERFTSENTFIQSSSNELNIITNNSTIEGKRFTFKNKEYLHLKVKSPESGDLSNTLVIAAIDISGSMGTDASLDNEGGGSQFKFSRLDLVKHSLKTVVKSLKDTDYLSLVPFSTNASVLLHPTIMSDQMKSRCNDLIDNLHPTNTTNIWDALRLSFEIASSEEHKNKNIAILLFTDGVPNVNPPRGIVPTMIRKLESINPNFTVSTFGFGYELDSDLLRNISNQGRGQFSFIPDASMVGTIFVNFLSNIMLNYANIQKINIESLNNSQEIIIGSLQYGQDKDYILEVPSNEIINVKYNGSFISFDNSLSDINSDTAFHLVRTHIINLIDQFVSNYSDQHKTEVINLHNEFKNIFPNVSNNIDQILRDLVSDDANEAQIYKAVSNFEWYEKWGKHYLFSIQRAHECMVCNNFKDPGVQIYGSEMFENLRDMIEETFCSLPPPTPSIRIHTNNLSNSSYTPPSMSSYMNSGGVCFDGNSVVIMETGGIKLVKDIKKGDLLFNNFRVKCVIKTVVHGEIDICELNNMLITPWHPVCMNDENVWVFPIDLVKPTKEKLDFVYNFVLEEGHYSIINGIKVVTLGHDFDTNNVIQHNYYGSDLVIQDLKRLRGWDDGLIVLDKPKFERDSQGKISKIL